ncbi:MAG TPA: tripartite tricarboxylate transporter substrate binding protein, partial [Burkholderiales bacterium]|nr:tripartite tricarboxylate transporter substrate binding protein [Burkholderiales bacterium]
GGNVIRTTLVVSVMVFSVLAVPAISADFPSRPVRLVVPLTPSSGADIAGRIVGRALSEAWKQTVVVDNRPGAGGQIGTQIVVRAAPDGHTLLVQSSSHTVNPAIYKSLPYDSLKDLVDVASLGSAPYAMVTAPGGPYRPLKSLIDAARAKPGEIPYASAGVGTSTHLTGEYFAQSAGVKLLHVPFKGSAEALQDVAAGRVAFYMAPINTAIGLIKDNRLTVLGVANAKRISMLPNVPTIAEQGLPGFEMDVWFGVWAPAATPRPVLQKLTADIRRAMESREVRDQYAKLGIEPNGIYGEEFARFVRSEMAKYDKVVKRSDIQPL